MLICFHDMYIQASVAASEFCHTKMKKYESLSLAFLRSLNQILAFVVFFLFFFLVLDWWANEKWFKYGIIKHAMEQWAIIITVNNYCKCTSKLGEVCIHCLKRTSKKGTLILNTQKYITSFLHGQQWVKHAFYQCVFSSNFNRTAHMEKAEKPSSGWTKRPLTCP